MKRSEQLRKAKTYLEAIEAICPVDITERDENGKPVDAVYCPQGYGLLSSEAQVHICKKFHHACKECLSAQMNRDAMCAVHLMADLVAEVEKSYETGGIPVEAMLEVDHD